MLVFNLITFINLLVVFLFLYFRKDNALPNKILALILINPGINFISNVNILMGNLENLPYLYFFAQSTALLFAPLVYVYVLLLLGRKISFKNPLFLLSALAVLFTFYLAFEFYFMPPEQQQLYLDGVLNEPYPMQMLIYSAIFILLQQIYFTVAAVNVYKHSKNIENYFSDLEKTKFRYVTRFIVLIWILNFITVFMYATLPTIVVEYIGLPAVLTTIYFFILYYAFHFNSIFTGDSYRQFLADNTIEEDDAEEKIKSTVNQEELRHIAQKLEAYLEEHRIYTNPVLNISQLSNEIGLSGAKISLALNKVVGKNFYDFVNEKRVECAKELLQKNRHLTIEAIAQESGFNSRATFYRAFKKHTGKLPTDVLLN